MDKGNKGKEDESSLSAEGMGYRNEIDYRCKELQIPRKNLKLWMERYFRAYKREHRKMELNPSYRSDATPEELCNALYEILIGDNKDNGLTGRNIVKEMFRTSWFQAEMDEALCDLQSFNEFGDIYYDIIEDVYLAERPVSEKDICGKHLLSHSSYYRRREEALRVCAITLWARCLKIMDFEVKRLEYIATYS